MFTPRSSGVLLHPTSLASPFGIGDLGDESRRFVDWLAEAGQRWWQILPMNPTLVDGSPYMSPSAFAGNPLLISPELLVRDGLLSPADLQSLSDFPGTVDFEQVERERRPLLATAHTNFRRDPTNLAGAFASFRQKYASWLDPHSEFMALREVNADADWHDWVECVDAHAKTLSDAGRAHLEGRIEFHAFVQFLFDRQWQELRRYAHERGVGILGDLPIYVATNSADVWAHRDLFRLDAHGRPVEVAGVPPDYFAATGQLWNNPIYDWEHLERTAYAWWIDRVRRTLQEFDVARIDHFRGFEAYWSVPAGEKTAINGRWFPGPREKLFQAIGHAVGSDPRSLPLIAEDLGVITDEVTALRKAFGLPGMRVLQFELMNSDEHRWNVDAYEADSAVYTGTHDNDTTLGWFDREIAPRDDWRDRVCRLAGADRAGIAWGMMEMAWRSSGDLAIAPMQDILSLSTSARMNTPGTAWPAAPNWRWRMTSGQLKPEDARRLAELTDRHRRRVPAS